MRCIVAETLRCLLVIGAVVFAARNATAGIVDFEDLTPTTPYTGPGGGAYWNGSDGSGGFTSRGIQFVNNYNSTYGSWDGWSYSNTTDTTTAGYTNQFSAYTGGAHSGTNYGVYYEPWSVSPTVIDIDPVPVLGAYVTNRVHQEVRRRERRRPGLVPAHDHRQGFVGCRHRHG